MTKPPTEIIYLAVNRWDSMVQREQHLMMGLSRSYRILFVDPPLSFLTLSLGKVQGKNRNFRSRLHRVNEQLIVYTPSAFPPFSHYLHWIHSLHTKLLMFLVRSLLKKFSFNNYVLGIGNPFLGNVVKVFSPRLSYYDCSDDYLASPRVRGAKELLRKLEGELVRSVDLVFCTSTGLVEAKSLLNQNCFLVPNGVDLTSFFKQPLKSGTSFDIGKIRKPILGYIGLIDERFDVDGLLGLAKKRLDWSIVMVGLATSKHVASALKGIPNIHLLGEKNYHDLPGYLEAFDVCLIPFKVNDFTKKIYPTKLHQYLATGKPVVSSRLPDLESFGSIIEFYSGVKEMEEAIERAIKGDSEGKALERKRVASENTWNQRVKLITEIFNSTSDKKKTSDRRP